MSEKISVVTPVYKNQDSIEAFINAVKDNLSRISTNFEIILVNDSSPDNSWDIINEIALKDNRIKGIHLSRNFGQHPAIFCGLVHSSGDIVIVMDCDLQEDPSNISLLINKYNEGYDIVYTYRRKRQFKIWKNIAAYFFTKIYNYLIDNKTLSNNLNVGTFSLISRKVVDNFIRFKDCQFHYLLLLRWMGFKHTYIEISHQKRKFGKSSYNFKRLFEHALVAILFQSDKLLRLNIYIGFFISLFSFIFGLFIIISYFIHGFAQGWASITVLILFSLGIILFSIGILGLYIGKMFEQTKQRPVFIVQKKINI